jgi:hypothetical protein
MDVVVRRKPTGPGAGGAKLAHDPAASPLTTERRNAAADPLQMQRAVI